MKKALAICLLVSAVILGANPEKKITIQSYENSIKSLMAGLDSENYGLVTSSAYMLGELKAENAVIPLMKMLRNSEDEETRIVAALALYKIGTASSIHAVYQASRFDESKRVRKLCLRFYMDYQQKTDL